MASVSRRALFAALACIVLAFVTPAWCAEDLFFDSNGVKIRYRMEGKGDPVVLIHGFSVNIERNWGSILTPLAADYQVIALDCRGHGKSDKPHDPARYGMEMVLDPARLLERLKIKKAHVVGYSMGAALTAKLLETRPDLLLTATLGGSAGIQEGGPGAKFMEVLADSLEQGKGFGPLIRFLTPANQPPPTEEEIEKANVSLSAGNDLKALAAVLRGRQNIAVSPEKLVASTVPVHAIIGDLDPLKTGVDALARQMPSLKVSVIEGANHMNAGTRPEFLKSLTAFLAEHRAAK